MDQRIKYTKMMISKAFLKLLKTKEIDKISITEICELAEINRTTFYRYYESPNDLLLKIEQERIEEIKAEIIANKASIDDTIRILLEKMNNNKDEWILLFENHTKHFVKVINDFFIKMYKISSSSSEDVLLNTFVISGVNGVIEAWAKGGMKETPEELSAHIKSIRKKLYKEKTN